MSRAVAVTTPGLCAGDLDYLDHYLADNTLAALRALAGAARGKEAYEAAFGSLAEGTATLTFATTLPGGVVVEMWPGSAAVPVPYAAAGAYADWVQRAQLGALTQQAVAIRRGFTAVVPTPALSLHAWWEAELAVCGVADIDVDLLMRHTEYASGYTATSPPVAALWATLRAFAPQQRTRFARFVFGQDRLPATDAEWEAHGMRMLIKCAARAGNAAPGAGRAGGGGGGMGVGSGGPSGSPLMGLMAALVGGGRGGAPPPRAAPPPLSIAQVDRLLPTADVCFANFALPAYSSDTVLRERLLVAISMDAGLDADDVR